MDCLPHRFGNEPGVRKIAIYQAGSSQHQLPLGVTNVMMHGPGVKLLDGLAVAKHQWVRDLHLPLPSSSYYPSRTILGPASQFLFVIGLDAGQLGYSLKTEGNGAVSQPTNRAGKNETFLSWLH
jgi:hypothetical protein